MNLLRGSITALLFAVVALSFMGWRWAASLPTPKQTGARVVLVLSATSALVGTVCIWRIRADENA
jgi:hypothetical protein